MKKDIIIGVLTVLVLTLSIYLVYDKFIDKKEVKDEEETVVTYKEYKKGEQVKLSDGYTYTVLYDSDKNQDYITVISNVGYYINNNNVENTNTEVFVPGDEQADFNVIYGSLGLTYDETVSKVLETVNSKYIKLDSSKLIEVNGSKVRLLTLDDIYNYYGKENFTSGAASIDYNGTADLFDTLTMADSSNFSNGKQMPLLTLTKKSIVAWTLGVPAVRPVVNIYKSNI